MTSEASLKQQYHQRQQHVFTLMTRLETGLVKHEEKFTNEPHYGWIGDLAEAERLLSELIVFIGGKNEENK